MRTRDGKKPVELGRESSGDDGLHSLDGTGLGNGSVTKTEDFSFGTGSSRRGHERGVREEAWFAPIESSASPDVLSFGECKDGVCPVPWLKDKEADSPVFTLESAPTLLPDNVNHPSHYTDGGIECIEAIEAQLTSEEYRGYLKGNICKYIWREKNKGGTESLKKAQWYLNRLIELEG
jgi:hypothetical protein